MSEIFSKILEWPVIVQGALGSALFWLLLLLGTKATQFSLIRTASLSRSQRLRALYAEGLRLKAAASEDNSLTTLATVGLTYISLSYAYRAAIALVLGQLFGQALPVLETVGYLFSLYYFFWAMTCTRDIPDIDQDKLEERIKEINVEIQQIEAKHASK